MDESQLREKLRKVESLFARAGTAGEKAAAGEAAERIRARLESDRKTESVIEMRFSLGNLWSGSATASAHESKNRAPCKNESASAPSSPPAAR